MKHGRNLTHAVFVLAVAAIVVTLASCDILSGLFAEPEPPPPKLTIKNCSSEAVSKIEMWETTEAYTLAYLDMLRVNLLLMLDPVNPDVWADYAVTLAKYLEESEKIMASPPYLTDTAGLAAGSSRVWELKTRGYLIRVNGDSKIEKVDLSEGDAHIAFTGDGWMKILDI
jgi:hypothetical protein